jgi:hypothetical protein
VAVERDLVRAYFDNLNRTAALRLGAQFQVIDWENYSTAGVGRPQELITRQTLVAGLAFGPAAGLGVGLAAGLTRRSSRIKPVEQQQWSWRRGLAFGLFVGLAAGLVAGLAAGLVAGQAAGLGVGLAVGLAAGLGFGLGIGLAVGFEPQPSVRPQSPCAGMQTALRTARILGPAAGLPLGLAVGLDIGLAVGLVVGPAAGLAVGLAVGLVIGLAAGLAVGLEHGGAAFLRHRFLCTLLQRDGLIPADLLGFLDYADSRILLRRAGGGYLFTHRLLQDHLAANTVTEHGKSSYRQFA